MAALAPGLHHAALAAGKIRIFFAALGSTDPSHACVFSRNLPSLFVSNLLMAGQIRLRGEAKPRRGTYFRS
jgi:hypothetical protein